MLHAVYCCAVPTLCLYKVAPIGSASGLTSSCWSAPLASLPVCCGTLLQHWPLVNALIPHYNISPLLLCWAVPICAQDGTSLFPHQFVCPGIHVTRVVQAPGEYVITFPRAYHGGFSNGFCVGEAVNFSIADWFPFGLEAANRYRRLGRLPVLAHDELLCLEGLALHGK